MTTVATKDQSREHEWSYRKHVTLKEWTQFPRFFMYKQLKCELKSTTPLIMHSGATVNPRHPISLLMKQFTAKRAKTADDHEIISLIEHAGGFYTTKAFSVTTQGYDLKVTGGGNICIPADCMEAALIVAFKKQKLGKQALGGMLVMQDSILRGLPPFEEFIKSPSASETFFLKRSN